MRSIGVIAIVAPLLVAGCAETVVVYEPVYQQRYVDGELEDATYATGELRTAVYGKAADSAPDLLTRATTEAMKGANRGQVVIFTPNPTDAARKSPYHVVMLFNAVASIPGWDVCLHPAAYAGKPHGERLDLFSAFCFEGTLVSQASGRVGKVAGLDDPTFRSLVRDVTLSLFPAYDYYDISDEGIPAG